MLYQEGLAIKNQYERDIVFDIRLKLTQSQKPVLIFAHGFKGFKDWGHFNAIANYFAEHGFIVVKLNFSFNGTTQTSPCDFVDLEAFGNNNFSKETSDLSDLITTIKNPKFPIHEKEIDKSKIFLVGHSKGGATSIISGHEEKSVSAVCTWSAILDIKNRYAGHELEVWKKAGVLYIENTRTNQKMPLYYQLAEDLLNNLERFNPPLILPKYTKPILLLHGDEDTTITLKESETVINTISNNNIHFEVLSQTDHTFGGSHPWDINNKLPTATKEACDKTIAFFKAV